MNYHNTVEPRLIGLIGTEGLSPLSQGHLYREVKSHKKTIIWGLKILTFIDGEPLKAGLLLRGLTEIDFK